MAIATEKTAETFLDIVADTPANCIFPLFAEDEIVVIYGKASLEAVPITDYTVELSEPDFDQFTVTPTSSLIDKIDALIALDATEINYMTVRRKLDYLTSVEPETVRQTAFLSREIDRVAMKLIQLNENLQRAVTLPPKEVGDEDTILYTPERLANALWGWDSTGTNLENKTPGDLALLTAFYQDTNGNVSIGNGDNVTAGLLLDVNGVFGVADGSAAAPSYTFRADTDTGLCRVADNKIGIAALGALALAITNPASAANYFGLQGAATANAPQFSVQGSDANIGMALSTKGTGVFNFYNNNFGAKLFTMDGATNAVNYVASYASATGLVPGFAVTGTDTNVSFALTTKGTGVFNFYSNSGAYTQFSIDGSTSATNYIQAFGQVGGLYPGFSAKGGDTNIGINLVSKGNAAIGFFPSQTSSAAFFITTTPNSVNYWQVNGNITGSPPLLFVDGTDTNIGANFATKGTGSYLFYTNTGTTVQFVIAHVASAVNYLQAQGNATGSGPSLLALGSDANIDLNLHSKGTGSILSRTNGTVRGGWDGNGNFYVGTAVLNTNATAGFCWITSTAGAPTGAATQPAGGAVPINVDTTNSRIYVRIGSTWKSVAVT